MSRNTYIGYIGYYISDLAQNVSSSDLRDYLISKLGNSLSSASDEDLKKVAMSLYFSHYIHLFEGKPSFEYVTSMSSHQLQKYLKKLEETDSIQVLYYTSPSKIEIHMSALGNRPSYLKNILDGNNTKSNKYSVKEIKNICAKYTRTELMSIAKDKKLSGRSKMNKMDLCKNLLAHLEKDGSQSKHEPKKKIVTKSISEVDEVDEVDEESINVFIIEYTDILGEYIDNIATTFGWEYDTKILVTDIEEDSGKYSIYCKFINSDKLVNYVKSNKNLLSLENKLKELIDITDKSLNLKYITPGIESVSLQLKNNELTLSYVLY